MTSPFKMKIKHYGETIVNQNAGDIDDLDEMFEDLKKKFKGGRN